MRHFATLELCCLETRILSLLPRGDYYSCNPCVFSPSFYIGFSPPLRIPSVRSVIAFRASSSDCMTFSYRKRFPEQIDMLISEFNIGAIVACKFTGMWRGFFLWGKECFCAGQHIFWAFFVVLFDILFMFDPKGSYFLSFT